MCLPTAIRSAEQAAARHRRRSSDCDEFRFCRSGAFMLVQRLSQVNNSCACGYFHRGRARSSRLWVELRRVRGWCGSLIGCRACRGVDADLGAVGIAQDAVDRLHRLVEALFAAFAVPVNTGLGRGGAG